MKKSAGPKLLNKKKSPDNLKEYPEGIPCPECGYRRWWFYSKRHIGSKISRVLSCRKCGHRVRTSETIESHSAPRLFARDPKTRRKVPLPG